MGVTPSPFFLEVYHVGCIGSHMEQYLQLELPLPIQLPPEDEPEVRDDKPVILTSDDLYVDFYI